MTQCADELETIWRSRLQKDYPQSQHQAILQWLWGVPQSPLTPEQLALVERGMNYRYRLLQERYLDVSLTQAYQNLISRLSSVFVLRQKIHTWLSLSQDRQRAVADVVQELVQELLNRDRYLQQQIAWIAQCTADQRLRDRLLLVDIEEYCLRSVRHYPLIVYRFINHQRRHGRGGITQIPHREKVTFLSEGADEDFNLFALAHVPPGEHIYREVQQAFEGYLAETIGTSALRWLNLHLQGHSPEEIAQLLAVSSQQVYRLREKVRYHAIYKFRRKQPELVATWLDA